MLSELLAAVLPGIGLPAPVEGSGPLGTGDRIVAEPSDRPRRTATAEIADLLADLTAAGARSLAFTRSRRGAESVAATTRAHLLEIDPTLAASVSAYRGGYLPEERRALERAIRSGALRALATTNALELGVDISGLDAVLIAGWPGTRVSLWQQAGRAGRAGTDGLVALVAREDPLDTFLVHHAEAIFDTPVEATVFDTTNPYVLAPHLCAAAAELPLRTEELDLFGPRTADLLDELVERGTLRRRPSGLVLDAQRARQPPDRPARLRRRPRPRRRVGHRPAARHGRRRLRRLDRPRRRRLRAPGRHLRRRRAAPRGRRRPGDPSRRRLRHLGALGDDDRDPVRRRRGAVGSGHLGVRRRST